MYPRLRIQILTPELSLGLESWGRGCPAAACVGFTPYNSERVFSVYWMPAVKWPLAPRERGLHSALGRVWDEDGFRQRETEAWKEMSCRPMSLRQ